MSAAPAYATEAAPIQYTYNKLGNVRAPIQGDGSIEVLLDMKLVQGAYATPENLLQLGGQAAEARSAGFVLSFEPATKLGIETLNEITGQWRTVPASSTYAVVASLV